MQILNQDEENMANPKYTLETATTMVVAGMSLRAM